MTRRLAFFPVILALGGCLPPREAARVAPAPAPAPEAQVAAEADPLELLRRADRLYEQGVDELGEGRRPEAERRFAEASQTLFSQVDDPALAEELRADFSAMLEKVRTWDGPPEAGQEPSELDASDAALADAPPAPAAATEVRPHAIPIDPEDERVKRYLGLYAVKRKESVEQALGRAALYRPMIEAELNKAGLPPELFWLAMTESEFKLFALSRSGAAGLWQFMPQTARKYGLEVSFWVDERYDPVKATRAAVSYLKDLHDWFGHWHLAMAAYNRGENGIGRDLTFTRATEFKTLLSRGAMPTETRHYIAKFMACVLLGEDPAKFGLKAREEKPEPFEEVELEKSLDLELAAKAAGANKDAIERLNPWIRTWCTPKDRPGFKLRIPAGTKEAFTGYLAKVEDWNPGPSFVRYKVQRGDYLGKIAKRYKTSVQKIMALNDIKSAKTLRPGMALKIQPGRGARLD